MDSPHDKAIHETDRDSIRMAPTGTSLCETSLPGANAITITREGSARKMLPGIPSNLGGDSEQTRVYLLRRGCTVSDYDVFDYAPNRNQLTVSVQRGNRQVVGAGRNKCENIGV